jgi:LuxR family transcriptional regulator, maltose regulon positive regulatory protein
MLATQARLGMTGQARGYLAALDDERAGSGEIRNADAVICLAEGDPAAALRTLQNVLDGTAPVIGYVTEPGLRSDALGQCHRETWEKSARAYQLRDRWLRGVRG